MSDHIDDLPEEVRNKTPQELLTIVNDMEKVLRDLHQSDTGELRNLSGDEQAAFDHGMNVRDTARKMYDEHVRIANVLRDRPAAAETAIFNINRYDTDPYVDVRAMPDHEARDKALRILDDRVASAHMTAPQKDAVDLAARRNTDVARRILVTENEHYKSAWSKLVTEPRPFLSNDEEQAMRMWQEYRAASSSSASGGYGIPVFIDPSIILTNQESDNPFLTIAKQVDINTNTWKGVSSAGMSWSFDAEGVEVSDDMTTLSQPSFNIFTARGFIPYSIEIGEDYPNFASEMAMLLAVGYDDLLLTKFSTGNGTTEPDGVITKLDATAGSEVLITTAGAFGAVDLYNVWKALPQKYRRRASFMSTVGVNNTARQFANGNNIGNFTVDLKAGFADTMFGRPVYENDHFTDFSSTTGHQNVMVVGDFSNYVVARRQGMSVELVPHLLSLTTNLPNGQRGWFAYARIGGDVVNTSAFRLLNQT